MDDQHGPFAALPHTSAAAAVSGAAAVGTRLSGVRLWQALGFAVVLALTLYGAVRVWADLRELQVDLRFLHQARLENTQRLIEQERQRAAAAQAAAQATRPAPVPTPTAPAAATPATPVAPAVPVP